VVSIEAGKKKQRYFDALFRTVVIGHLGFGAIAAKFKSISELARMCRMSRNTAARGIGELKRLNVFFEVGKTCRPLLLCVNPNVETWLVAKTIGDEAWLTMLAEWRNFCCTTQLELKLPDFGPADPTLQQLLALVNFDNAVENTRPTVGQSDGNCSIVEQGKRPTVGQEERPTVGQPAQHNNVGVRVRSPLRHTCDAQEAGRVLDIAFKFMAEDRRVSMENEKKIPVWAVLAALPDWPRPLEVAVKDCREARTATTKNNAARLMDAMKATLGPDLWRELFPHNQARWTR
jgi:hypothetical protein